MYGMIPFIPLGVTLDHEELEQKKAVFLRFLRTFVTFSFIVIGGILCNVLPPLFYSAWISSVLIDERDTLVIDLYILLVYDQQNSVVWLFSGDFGTVIKSLIFREKINFFPLH